MPELTEWENFYVIVGSAAGALIGLQFVVLTLIASLPTSRSDAQAGGAFATPSVVHFGVVLLLSAIVSAPWREIGYVAIHFRVIGFFGIIYTAIIVRRVRGQTVYQPVFEDWLFHVLLPFVAYAVLLAAAFLAITQTRLAMFFVGGATLLMLFVGIHNAWDAITYHVFVQRRKLRETERNT